MNISTVRKFSSTPQGILIAASIITYFGAAWLGLYIDDYSNLHGFITNGVPYYIDKPTFNRFPAFAFIVYPILLYLPLAISHIIIVVFHVLNCFLILSILEKMNIPKRYSFIVSALFLVWPIHYEALFWPVASTIVFGSSFMLFGTHLCIQRKYSSGILSIMISLLFSEGLFLPSIYLIATTLLFCREPRWKLTFLSIPVIFYSVFQFARNYVNQGERTTQYVPGLEAVPKNIFDLLVMTFTLGGSRDLSWLWDYGYEPVDVTQLLNPWFILVATLVAGIVARRADQFSASIDDKKNVLSRYHYLVSFVGIVVSMSIYSLVSSNLMQPRYVYLSSLFFLVFVSFCLFWLEKKRRWQGFTNIIFISLLTMSIYRGWSNIWVNWYPAKVVSELIIDDVRIIYEQTGITQIILVDEPRSVGNAYTMSHDWAYDAAGRMYVDPDVRIQSDALHSRQLFAYTELQEGQEFASTPCIFVSWRNKNLIASYEAVSWNNRWVFDCRTGKVAQNLRPIQPEQALYSVNGSRVTLTQFYSSYLPEWVVNP